MYRGKNLRIGFTLLELLIVLAIIGILAAITLASLNNTKREAEYASFKQEMRSAHMSLLMYQAKYGDLPPDVERDVPPGLEEFLAGGEWPNAVFSGAVYDWDRFTPPEDPTQEVLQISVRFCPIGQPSQCNFPKYSWAEDFEVNSSVYYCIQGACRAHPNEPLNYPGHCVNCVN